MFKILLLFFLVAPPLVEDTWEANLKGTTLEITGNVTCPNGARLVLVPSEKDLTYKVVYVNIPDPDPEPFKVKMGYIIRNYKDKHKYVTIKYPFKVYKIEIKKND
jgi:hypothetical protein